MSNRRRPRTARVNGTPPGLGALVVPSFPGIEVTEWSDLPPAAYPPAVAEQIIRPRLEAGTDLIRLNGYLCDGCHGLTLTYDRHPGITPALVDHDRFDPATRCPGMARSLGYPADAPPAEWSPSHEWYRPGEPELLGLPDPVIDHVLRGGLLLRPIALEAGRA